MTGRRGAAALEAALQRIGSGALTGPFEQLIGYRCRWIEGAGLCVELDLDHRHTSQFGVAHGGVTLTLLDTVGGVATALEVEDLERIATISFSANFIKAVPCGPVVATAVIHHLGRGVAHLSMELRAIGPTGHLLATGQGAYRLFRRDGTDELNAGPATAVPPT